MGGGERGQVSGLDGEYCRVCRYMVKFVTNLFDLVPFMKHWAMAHLNSMCSTTNGYVSCAIGPMSKQRDWFCNIGTFGHTAKRKANT